MKNTIKNKKLILLFFIIFFVLVFQKISVKANQNEKNVLIINSYNRGYDWTDGECEGILKVLKPKENLIEYVEYMDWKRYNSEENLNKLYEYYKYRYLRKKIDLIIATDDAALDFAIKHRKELFSNAPLVFGGVTKASADILLKNISNVTGVYEATDPEGTLKEALKMKPETKEIYVIHDNTETGQGYGSLVKNAVFSINSNIKFYDLSQYSIDEICNKVSTLDNNSLIIFDAYSIDAKGLSLPMSKFSNMICKSSSVPVFTTAEALIGEGCIGGSVLSAKVHGEDIGTLASKILKGEDIKNISIIDKKSVRSMFDYNVLEKHGITLDRISANSTIINKPYSFYQTYKFQIYFIVSVFLALIVLICYLIINIGIRKKAEKKLLENNDELTALYEEIAASQESLYMNYDELNKKQKELLLSEEKYRLVAESSMDIIWEEDMISNTRKYSEKLFDILGYTTEELKTYNEWISIIHPDDYFMADKIQKVHEIKEDVTDKNEYRVKCKNGEHKWILSNTRPQYDESGIVIKIFGAYTDITKLKEQRMKINNLAFYDSVTGIPNRISLQDKVDRIIETGKNFVMFFIDLDNFKIINDSFGHAIGDKLLICVSERLNSINKDEYEIFRLGGDEFILIYSCPKNNEIIESEASKILQIISEPYTVEDKYLHISASMGIVCYPKNGNMFNELLKNADNALYKSKESGKNKYTFFDEAMGDAALEKIKLLNNLHKAIENNEFVLYYQPIINVNNGNIVGMEALIRWISPEEGLIPPDKFISIAEESGNIIDIGNWVMINACNFARELYDKGYRDFYISINVSGIQLIQKNFNELLFDILDKTGIPPEYLMIEITESIFMESFDQMIKVFSEIRERGIKIALDDFGCGYSSLTYLKQLPMDSLKIDKSFIIDILNSSNKDCITGLIITLAKQLGFNVIAEGIEKNEQLDYLKQYNCDLFQGYLVSKPVPKEEILKLL